MTLTFASLRLPFASSAAVFFGAIVLLGAVSAPPVHAIALWAKRYGVPCSTCHTVPPALNEGGHAFEARGFRFQEGETPQQNPGLPANIRAQVRVQSLEDERSSDVNLRAVQLQSGGPLGKNASYLTLVYLSLEGGGSQADDVFVRLNKLGKTNLSLQVGQYLPEIVYPNAQRLTPTSPTIYARGTVANGWFLQQRQLGATLSSEVGEAEVSASIFNGNGTVRDRGTTADDNDFKDWALSATYPVTPNLTLGAFHYSGHLTVTPEGFTPYRDRFRQSLLSAEYLTRRNHVIGAVTQGRHNNIDGTGRAASNFGYFLEGRRYFGNAAHQDAALMRWDWANPDKGVAGHLEGLTFGYSRFLAESNLRFTGEYSFSPQGNRFIGEVEWHF